MTLAFTYYNAPKMLTQQLKYWRMYEGLPVQVLVIDDGSKEFPAIEILKDCDLDFVKLVCIDPDIYMNLSGARNLAFSLAEDWVFQLDIDHVVPHRSVKTILTQFKVKEEYYIPDRKRVLKCGGLEPLTRHSDTFVMHKDLFWSVGGYDEVLREYYYSGPCYLFRKSLKRIHTEQVNLDGVFIHFYGNTIISDASPLMQYPEKKKYPKARNYHFSPDREKQLLFGWEEVEIRKGHLVSVP